MLLKKNIFRIVAVIYDIVALFWCYVMASALIYEFTNIHIKDGSIGIIVGADLPTLTFMLQTGAIFSCLLHITFALLNIVIPLLLTIAAFRIKTNRALNIWLIVLLGIALTIFILIPTQMYIVALYAAVLSIGYLAVILKIAYFVLSGSAIVLNILVLTKRKADIK
jgi:hypothetical protein